MLNTLLKEFVVPGKGAKPGGEEASCSSGDFCQSPVPAAMAFIHHNVEEQLWLTGVMV